MTRPPNCAKCKTLRNCLMWHLDEAESIRLQREIRTVSMGRGAYITVEGQATEHLHVLKTGWSFVTRRGLDGQRRLVALTGGGATFGIWSYFGHPNNVSAVGASPLQVCQMPVQAVREVAARQTKFSWQLSLRAHQAVSVIASWSELMRLNGAVNQIAYALVLMGRHIEDREILLPFNIRFAELLGTTRETVMRSLNTLEQEGRIEMMAARMCRIDEQLLLERVRRDAQELPASAADAGDRVPPTLEADRTGEGSATRSPVAVDEHLAAQQRQRPWPMLLPQRP